MTCDHSLTMAQAVVKRLETFTLRSRLSTGVDNRFVALTLCVLAVLIPCYLACLRVPVFGIADDGDYVVLGKALATGQGYRLISTPQPIIETKYPPLFPALIALV